MRKIDAYDTVLIKKKAQTFIKVNTDIRLGQAIYCAADEMYPMAVKKLRSTDVDCYFNDEKITMFLNELQKHSAE